MPLLVSSLKSLHTLMCFHENVCSGTLLNWWQHEGLEGLEVYMSNILTLYQDRTEAQLLKMKTVKILLKPNKENNNRIWNTQKLKKKKAKTKLTYNDVNSNTATHRSDFCASMGVCGRPGDPSQRGYGILIAEIGSLVLAMYKQFCREAH